MDVKITRTTAKYRRSRNGAWIGAGHDTETRTVPEATAIEWVLNCGLSSWIDIEWPDGHREHFGRGATIAGIYGPGGSRLRPYAAGHVYGDPETPLSAWYPERVHVQAWRQSK